MGHAEFLRNSLALVVDIHAYDLVGADHLRALDHIQANAAEAEDHDVRAGLDLGSLDDSADSGGDAAADVTDLLKGCVFPDLRNSDFRQNSESFTS